VGLVFSTQAPEGQREEICDMSKANPGDFWGKATEDLPQVNWSRAVTVLAAAFILIVVLIVVWTGFYTVESSERGVVRRFGEAVRDAEPGLHFKLPWPIEVVNTPKVKEVKRVEIGFRTIPRTSPAQYRGVSEESLMLTGDTNIVDLDLIVQYKITDVRDYLFNVRDVQGTIKDAAEAAIRQIVGNSNIDDILTIGKDEAALGAQDIIQKIVDLYGCGVLITAVQLQDVYPPEQVRSAFDAVNSAREQKNQMINEAEAYKERIVPEARGRAEKVILEAEGYREQRVAEAKGDAGRFLTLLAEYKKAPDVTRERLYIETMEKILPEMKKFIVEKEEGALLKLLPLQEGGLRP